MESGATMGVMGVGISSAAIGKVGLSGYKWSYV